MDDRQSTMAEDARLVTMLDGPGVEEHGDVDRLEAYGRAMLAALRG